MTDQPHPEGQHFLEPYRPPAPSPAPYQRPRDQQYQQPQYPQPQYQQPQYQQPQSPYHQVQGPAGLGYVPVVPIKNGFATAALTLGIIGFVLTPIPLGVGLVLGGGPDIAAIVFGILGVTRSANLYGVGKTPAVFGLVLGGLGFLSIFLGAGTLW